MGLCRSCLLLTAILFGVLAYSIYVPPYEDYEEKVAIGCLLAGMKLNDLLVSAAKMLGYDDILTRRTIFDHGLTPSPGKTITQLDVRDTAFDSVAVRLYRPIGEAGKQLPGVVYMHGGGWVMGSVHSYDRVGRRLADDLKAVVASVDYRLSPEFPFPIPFEDCVTATRYFMKNADKYEVDPTRISVAGDSAGGNLAAAVALKLRDHSPPLMLQLLLYPTLQTLDLETPSFQTIKNDIFSVRKLMPVVASNYASGNYTYSDIMDRNAHTPLAIKEAMAKTYLNHDVIPEEYRQGPYKRPKLEAGDDKVWNELKHILLNPYFSPLIASNLSGLPTAVIVTCGRDPLRDDGFMYGHRLKEAGNDVTHLHYEGAVHGFYMFFDLLNQFDKYVTEINKVVKEL